MKLFRSRRFGRPVEDGGGVGGGGGVGWDSHINMTEMLAVSLGNNCRFWS